MKLTYIVIFYKRVLDATCTIFIDSTNYMYM